MGHGGRITRRFAAILLTFGLIVTAAPAHADADSPERAVNTLWDNLQFGEPDRAVSQLLPECRKKGRPVFRTLAEELSNALDGTPFFLEVRNYSEKVNGRNARVKYDLRLGDQYFDQYIDTFPSQRWVLKGSKWFLDCRTF